MVGGLRFDYSVFGFAMRQGYIYQQLSKTMAR